MQTEMEMFTKQIKEVEETGDFDKAMDLAKFYAWKVIERNAMGRAVERAVEKVCGKEKYAEVTKVALQERIAGDKFAEEEQKFYEEMFTIWD